MLRRLVLVSFILTFAISAHRAAANCGSECSCPLEQPNSQLDARLLFDVTQLYIDQDQPRVGTNDASVGAIPSHHDEVRTVNRVSNFRLAYRPAAGWSLGATLPFIHRTHEHIHRDPAGDEYERWNDQGIGDLEFSASRAIATAGGSRFRIGLGLKTPTGKQSPALTAEGEPIEASARIGTGSWDFLANLGADWSFHAPGKGSDGRMPLRLTITGRANGRGLENFRHGAEAQLHLATEYPLATRVAALLQTNYRARAKDDVGNDAEEDAGNTGGVAVYATPGIRVDAVPGFSIYGMAQFPLYERVNGIQVVARTNLLVGISRSIL
jgi:hypothetical protein